MSTEMMKILLVTNFLFSCSYSYVINYDLTKVIAINDTETYFGYSVLLQRGNPPIAIVGAPKKVTRNLNSGSVYRCYLDTLSCSEYTRIYTNPGIKVENKNPDFLGSVIDGDDVTDSNYFTCAPRFISSPYAENYFMRGRCFQATSLFRSSLEIQPLKNTNDISTYMYQPYYDAGFAEAGFSMVYMKELKELIIGAPGKSHWNGALIRYKLFNYRSTVYAVTENWAQSHDSYYGYSVSWGKFITGSLQEIWYVSGGPRNNKLRGGVMFFDHFGDIKAQLLGEELGSYFGASVLVIHKINAGDDILVGAPTYSGDTFDEGCVYYYKNKNNGTFASPMKLVGKSTKSRFGTTIADVGDIDLDSYNDIAIAAPYDDDGVGAVYLYYGTFNGFSVDKFHKISPSNFNARYPNMVIRGFGLGISRGNDLDNNGHNDLAIGAYLTGQVFYFRTYDVIDVQANIWANIHTLYITTKNFSITYCLTYAQRNKKHVYKLAVMDVFSLDNRIETGNSTNATSTIPSSQRYCNKLDVVLKDNYFKNEPLSFTYKYKVAYEDFKEENFNIPVSYGCGKDNICITNMSVTATHDNTNKVVIGLTNALHLNVTVVNSGDPAFESKLYLILPPTVNLINLRECYFEHGSYICLIPGPFRNERKKSFLLDLENLEPNRTHLPIELRIESDGQEVNLSDNTFKVDIPVMLQSNLYMDSMSQPENIQLTENKHTINMDHYFMVSNQGPSPVKFSLVVMVPYIDVNGNQTLESTAMEYVDVGIGTECTYLNKTIVDATKFNVELPQNDKSVTLSCFENQLSCMQFLCEGGYFPKSSENAVILVKLKISTKVLEKFANNKDAILIATGAYLNNGTNQIFSTTTTTIYGFSTNSKIPLWVYIIATIAGGILLLLLILLLYKCNFFKRDYKERLQNEQEGSVGDMVDNQEEEVTEEDKL